MDEDKVTFASSMHLVLSTPPPPRRFLPISQRGKVQSLEVLTPQHDSPLREAPLWGCILTMLSTIIGGGALSLPYAFRLAGVGGGLLILLGSAAASDFALYALCSASRRTGTSTLAELAAKAQGPRLENAVVVALFILCLFVAVAYTRLLRDLLAIFLVPLTTDPNIIDRALVIVVAFVLFPLSLYRELHRLRYAAFTSFLGALCVALLFAYRAWPAVYQNDQTLNDLVSILGPSDPYASTWMKALEALPIMSCAFLCQFNVLSVHGRLSAPTRPRLKRLLHIAVGIAFLFYVLFGISGQIVCADTPDAIAQDALSCLSYNDGKKNNQKNERPDIILALAGGAFGISIMMNTPALIIPLRDSLLLLFAKTSAALSTRRGHRRWNPRDGESVPLANIAEVDYESGDSTKAGVKKKNYSAHDNEEKQISTEQHHDEVSRLPAQTLAATARHFFLTLSIVVVVIICAQNVPGVASVWAIAGSSVGLFIAYMLPCYLYLRVRGHKEEGTARLRNAICFLLCVSSSFLAIICTYRSASSIILG